MTSQVSTVALSDRLAEISERAPFEVRWKFHDLRGGSTHGRGESHPVPDAGTSRVVLYLACLHAASQGTLDLTASVRYEARHREGHDAGILRWMDPGLTISLGDALAQVIITGDGVASAMVLDHLDTGASTATDLITEFCRAVGLSTTRPAASDDSASTVDVPMVTSAEDQLALVVSLRASAEGGTAPLDLGLSPDLAREALRVMSSVLRTDGITAKLPGHGPFLAHVAHTACDGGTGDRPASHWADAGIAYQDETASYALAVFCTDVPAEIDGLPGQLYAIDTIGELSAACWNR